MSHIYTQTGGGVFPVMLGGGTAVSSVKGVCETIMSSAEGRK